MVTLGRFELPTCGLGNRRSIHLSYRATSLEFTPSKAVQSMDFVALAHEIGIRPRTTLFPLADINRALDAVDGAAVVLC